MDYIQGSIPKRDKIFSPLQINHTGSKEQVPSCSAESAFLSSGKRQRREADHLPASGVEGMNNWSRILLSLHSSMASSGDIKYMCQFDYDIKMDFEEKLCCMDRVDVEH